VLNHSNKLSPFGPALQLGGGSSVISANSFCIRLADVLRALLNCFLAGVVLAGFILLLLLLLLLLVEVVAIDWELDE
jgi:hypothetical protein